MAESVFEIRRLKKEDLGKFYFRNLFNKVIVKYHAFSDAEVWNVGIDVYEKMFEISPNGFFCAENSETREIVSFCGAVDIGVIGRSSFRLSQNGNCGDEESAHVSSKKF